MGNTGFLRGARKQGLFAIALGIVAFGSSFHLARTSGMYSQEVVLIGCVSLPVGLAQILFPGSKDIPAIDAGPDALANSIAGLTAFELGVWIAAAVLGGAVGLYVIIAL